MRWKRPLYLFHRWAGIVLCAFFALWFVSGIFMMYVEFPQLTRPERLAALPALDFSNARLSPDEAASRLSAADFSRVGTPSGNRTVQHPESAGAPQMEQVRLGMLLDRPVYFFHPADGTQPRAVFADDGTVMGSLDTATATRIAADFVQQWPHTAGRDARAAIWRSLVQTDQWTVSAGLNGHRPLHRVALQDPRGTELYVSSTTGEVVRDTHRTERVLNYFAAVTHWIYPTVLRRYPQAWEYVVDALSVAGTLLAASGLWIGVLRWRRKRQPGKPAVPYRGIMRWHYFTGIIFGAVTLTWIFSGLMSMNPGKLNPPRSPSPDERLVMSGKPLTLADFPVITHLAAGNDAVEAELLHYDAQPFYLVTSRDGGTQLVAPDRTEDVRLPDVQSVLQRAAGFMPDAPLAQATVLARYDNYYYTRHPERGGRPLPVVRIEFADPQRTWFHVDPAHGRVLERSTSTNRLYRWLYNGLHSWDILWLWERRPLWDIAVIAFSLGGLTLSMLGIVIGVRRLRMQSRAPTRQASGKLAAVPSRCRLSAVNRPSC